MAIVDELKKLIKTRGGSAAGVQNIQDAVAVLNKLESENASEETTEETIEQTDGQS